MSKLNNHDESIRRLAEGYKEEFAEVVAADERFHELLQTISEEFVAEQLPIVNEDDVIDVCYELMMRCTTKSV